MMQVRFPIPVATYLSTRCTPTERRELLATCRRWARSTRALFAETAEVPPTKSDVKPLRWGTAGAFRLVALADPEAEQLDIVALDRPRKRGGS